MQEAERSIEPIVERLLPVLRKRLQFNQFTDDAVSFQKKKKKFFFNSFYRLVENLVSLELKF